VGSFIDSYKILHFTLLTFQRKMVYTDFEVTELRLNCCDINVQQGKLVTGFITRLKT
jgi:hypothetical protein